MPFPEKVRLFDLAAQGYRCQTLIYKNDQVGWTVCGSRKDLEDDHIYPESELLYLGTEDPSTTYGIIRCQQHHTGQGIAHDDDGTIYIAPYGSPEWSRHPDMGQALIDYRNGDKKAFLVCGRQHHIAAQQHIPITNDTWAIREKERLRVQELSTRYTQKTGIVRPEIHHKKFVKKHWYDVYFFGDNR